MSMIDEVRSQMMTAMKNNRMTENPHYIIYKGVLPNGKSKRIQFN